MNSKIIGKVAATVAISLVGLASAAGTAHAAQPSTACGAAIADYVGSFVATDSTGATTDSLTVLKDGTFWYVNHMKSAESSNGTVHISVNNGVVRTVFVSSGKDATRSKATATCRAGSRTTTLTVGASENGGTTDRGITFVRVECGG